MGLVPDAKSIANLVQTAMKPTMDQFVSELKRTNELLALQVELSYAEVRGQPLRNTIHARVRDALGDT